VIALKKPSRNADMSICADLSKIQKLMLGNFIMATLGLKLEIN